MARDERDSSSINDPTEETVFTSPEEEQTDSTLSGRRDIGRFGPEVFRPVLICLAGSLRGQRRALDRREIVIGRSGRSDWRLNDSAASRVHTQINYENFDRPEEMPECSIEDLGSRNGTELNGELVQGRVPLRERDRILIGSTVIGFFVRDEAELRYDESLYESATRDILTGLDNRRQLSAYMRHHVSRANRHGAPLSFLLLDVDHFKAVNDEHGHDVGDIALKHVAAVLRGSVRDSDLVARWGGEEFAVCLPDTDAERAMALADRIRRAMETSPVPLGARGEMTLRVSIGGAAFRAGDTSESLFQRADKMLYHAKDRGRNRVEFSDETVELEDTDH